MEQLKLLVQDLTPHVFVLESCQLYGTLLYAHSHILKSNSPFSTPFGLASHENGLSAAAELAKMSRDEHMNYTTTPDTHVSTPSHSHDHQDQLGSGQISPSFSNNQSRNPLSTPHSHHSGGSSRNGNSGINSSNNPNRTRANPNNELNPSLNPSGGGEIGGRITGVESSLSEQYQSGIGGINGDEKSHNNEWDIRDCFIHCNKNSRNTTASKVTFK